MPKETFNKLKEAKRKSIINAFLLEFSLNTYDDASINPVIKKLDIAKGSIYQYFDDKLDLFTYLISVCNKAKAAYVSDISRENYPDFWEYYKSLIEAGMKFDHENPIQSVFLHKLEQNLSSKSTRHLLDKYKRQILEHYKTMVQYEIERGFFRQDISINTLSHFLYRNGLSINEQYLLIKNIDLKAHSGFTMPIISDYTEFSSIVNDNISLMKAAFNKINT